MRLPADVSLLAVGYRPTADVLHRRDNAGIGEVLFDLRLGDLAVGGDALDAVRAVTAVV